MVIDPQALREDAPPSPTFILDALAHFQMVIDATRTPSLLSWGKVQFENAVRWCIFWENEMVNLSGKAAASLKQATQKLNSGILVPLTLPQLRCGADMNYDKPTKTHDSTARKFYLATLLDSPILKLREHPEKVVLWVLKGIARNNPQPGDPQWPCGKPAAFAQVFPT